MNTKINKLFKLFVSALFVATNCFFFTSCSNELDGDTNKKLSFSTEQRLEIMALAKKYGLDVTITDEGNLTSLPSMEEIENDFQEVYAVMHTPQKFVLTKKGKCKSILKKGPLKVAGSREIGDWKDSSCHFSVSVSWINGVGTVNSSFISTNPKFIDYQQTSSPSWCTSNMDIITFNFEGNANYKGNIKLRVSGSGFVNMITGSGQVFDSVSE